MVIKIKAGETIILSGQLDVTEYYGLVVSDLLSSRSKILTALRTKCLCISENESSGLSVEIEDPKKQQILLPCDEVGDIEN